MPNLKFPRDPRQCSDVIFCGLLRVDFLSHLRSTLQSKAPLPPRPEARRGREGRRRSGKPVSSSGSATHRSSSARAPPNFPREDKNPGGDIPTGSDFWYFKKKCRSAFAIALKNMFHDCRY
ncbi:hypothetical protein ISCGN_007172 [Ixodes scapularis]